MSLLGPYLAACALLIAGGSLKAARPHDTARALRQPVVVVRVAAIVEALLGLAALVQPNAPGAAAVALTYIAFAAYVLRARHSGGALATCGCFGEPDTAPTVAHAVVNAVLAVSAGAVAVGSDGDVLTRVLADAPGNGVPLVLVSVTCAVLAFGVLSHLGRVEGARRLFREAA
jgi:hypothetical protein